MDHANGSSTGGDARPERLLLIDGHALVYRAYFALQNSSPLTSPKGELTTGAYGFTSMLLKALEDLKPTHVVAAFDTSAPTFRHDASTAYKATRQAAPEGLRTQVPLSCRVLEAMGIPIYRLPGYEADDILGTLTTESARLGIDTIVLTGDTDLLQLVGPHVRVLTSRQGISDTVLYDDEKVAEKYGGLKPSQLADFKALRGDSSDNIAGVPGIGDKTAQKLLLEFGSVENLLQHLDRLPEKQRAQLVPYQQQVLTAKHLTTIVCDTPIDLQAARAPLGDIHSPAVISLFHELGFKSLVPRLPKAGATGAQRADANQPQMGLFADSDGGTASPSAAPPPETTDALPTTRVIDTEQALEALVAELRQNGAFSFNVQATGTLPVAADLVGIGLAAGDDLAAYVPVAHTSIGVQLPADLVFDRLRPLFADPAIAKRAHNAKFHAILLARHGVPVEGLAFDTMIAAYLLESGQRALALRDLAWTKLQVELPAVQTLLGTGRKAISMAQLTIPEAADYAAREAALVERLVPLLERELEEASQSTLFREVELPLVPVLARMELHGIAVDRGYLADLGRELQERLAALETEIYALAGHPFNINSTEQLGNVLFQELSLHSKARRQKTKSGQQSTRIEVLEELRDAHPIVNLVLEHRQLLKLKSTYVDALFELVNPHTGRVHTSFNQTVAATGRLSSSDPNLQNIPIRTDVGRRVRRAFQAEQGQCLLSADYSQIELRILAHMADDPTLLEAFAQGEDPHAATAAEVMGLPLEAVTADQRRIAKMVNYGVLYGMSGFGLASRLELPQAQADAFIQRYFERFGTVREFQDKVVNATRTLGYAETMQGRRRYLPEIRSPIHAVREAAIRAAINAPIQGTASDIVKIAMIRVQQLLDREAPAIKMLLQVHDELLLEGPRPLLLQIAPQLCEVMEAALTLDARLHVDLKVGENWEDLQPLTLPAPTPS